MSILEKVKKVSASFDSGKIPQIESVLVRSDCNNNKAIGSPQKTTFLTWIRASNPDSLGGNTSWFRTTENNDEKALSIHREVYEAWKKEPPGTQIVSLVAPYFENVNPG